MLSSDDLELLQRYQDGSALPQEAARAEALLTSSAEARRAAAALRALADGMAESALAEPDEGAVERIISRVRSLPPPRRESWFASARRRWARTVRDVMREGAGREPRMEESMSSRSKIVFGISTAAVIVLAGLWMTGVVPPVDDGADASIGAAKRYQAPQMGSQDVALGDTEAQAFMQSETFDRLLKDPDARKALASAEMRALFADA
jgi:hypothetical protein